MLKGQGTPLMESYVYACLESTNIREYMNLNSPTWFRVQFIERLQTGNWPFRKLGRRNVDRAVPWLYEKTHTLGLLWNQWDQPMRLPRKAQYIRMFMALCARDVAFDNNTQKFVGAREVLSHQERARQNQSNRQSGSNDASLGAMPQNKKHDTENEISILQVNMAKFGDAPQRNALFAGLVQDYPGWIPFAMEDDFEDEIPDEIPNEIDYSKLREDFLIDENFAGLSLGDELNELVEDLSNIDV